MRVLIIEDEIYLAEALSHILKKNNYTVDCVYDGEDGLNYAMIGIYDVIILDVVLPNLDGISIIKHIRKKGLTTPVILLTAKSEIEDKVKGLDSGADDYLAKPFSTEELMARIRALARRTVGMTSDNVLHFGDITLSTTNLTLSTKTTEIILTRRECDLMEFLILRNTMISSKEKIIEKLWGFDSKAESNHVEVYISFLRKKLGFIGSRVAINTFRGVGYKLKV